MNIELNTLNNKFRNAVLLTVVVLSIAITLMPDLAFAQGQGQALVDYSYEEYGRPMLNGGIIAVAILMFMMRFSLPAVAMVAAGGLTFANYDQIASLIGA